MITTWLVLCAAKAALLLAVAWAGTTLLRSASARHQIWLCGVIGALAVPVLAFLMPAAAADAVATSHAVTAPVLAVHGAMGEAVRTMIDLRGLVAVAWAVGSVLVLGQVARGHLAARGLVRAAALEPNAAATHALREAAVALGFARSVILLRSETIRSPMTVGVIHPRVLLPPAADHWPAAALRAVLVHELAHVQRRDMLVQLLAQLVCALYWWNPLAWLAARRLRSEREQACDDRVLATGTLASGYASQLLALARSMPQGAAICMVDHAGTAPRLRRILDARAVRAPLRPRVHAAAIAATTLGSVLLACTSAPPSSGARATATLGTLSLESPYVRSPEMFGAPPAQDPVDLALVAAHVKREMHALEQCYQRRLIAAPSLAGRVEIHAYIAKSGEVMDQCITTDNVGDVVVTACVNELVEKMTFPALRAGAVDVSFPFDFTPPATVANR